jgi:hypothetical protein
MTRTFARSCRFPARVPRAGREGYVLPLLAERVRPPMVLGHRRRVPVVRACHFLLRSSLATNMPVSLVAASLLPSCRTFRAAASSARVFRSRVRRRQVRDASGVPGSCAVRGARHEPAAGGGAGDGPSPDGCARHGPPAAGGAEHRHAPEFDAPPGGTPTPSPGPEIRRRPRRRSRTCRPTPTSRRRCRRRSTRPGRRPTSRRRGRGRAAGFLFFSFLIQLLLSAK